MNRIDKKLRLCVFWLGSLLTPAVLAQTPAATVAEPDPQVETQAQAGEEDPTEADTELPAVATESAQSRPSEDVFVPSEDISQDRSVSFPIDI